ncbi:MAG: 2Fe-2S iron-sulfur cluster-binding protein [Burkholderiales bacterium]
MRIQVNARNRGYDFEAAPGEKVLYAGLRAGIDLPYECATGTCGTCKAKLVSGRVRDGWPEAPGRKFTKPEAGEFLMCQCVAESDVTLQVPKFINRMDSGAPDARSGIVREPRILTHDVIAFDLELERPCDFDAGQFMVLAAPGVAGYRGYSMVNYARGARRLSFVAKNKPGGGFSDWLFGADRNGARLEGFGPLGMATFDPSLGKNVLCIAGGSGVAGMMSILARAASADYFERHRGWVFFGVRTMRDTFFLRELSDFRKHNLEITVGLSEEEIPEQAKQEWPALRFERGLAHEVAKRNMAGKYRDVRAYIAGPPPAVDAAIRVVLLDGKLTTDNVSYDKYS